jgi:predicted SAM-dependent methyltransferase
MKLNIGSGENKRAGYLGVDITPHENVDIIHNILEPFPMESGSVEAIWTCATLEHFVYEDAKRILQEFHRMLAPGGILEIAVPSMDKIATAIMTAEATWERIQQALYGARVNEYDIHKVLWSFGKLAQLLMATGFGKIQEVPYSFDRHRQFDYMMQIVATKE